MVAAHGQLDHMPAPPDPAAPPPFSLSERGQLRVVRARTVEEPTVRGARTVYARRLRPTFVAEEPGLRVCSRPEEDRAGRYSIVYTAARLVFALLLQEERDELDTEVLADEGERNRPPAASRGEEGLVLHRALEELPQAWHVPGVATRGADDLTGDICHAYGAGDACRKHW